MLAKYTCQSRRMVLDKAFSCNAVRGGNFASWLLPFLPGHEQQRRDLRCVTSLVPSCHERDRCVEGGRRNTQNDYFKVKDRYVEDERKNNNAGAEKWLVPDPCAVAKIPKG